MYNNNEYELLSNFDLVELGQMMGLNINVVSKDRLLGTNYKDNIINLDDFGNEGTHWVALFVSGSNAVYFDSFGQEPPLSVIQYCKGKKLIFSDYIIQNLVQSACGYYCLAFLHFMNFTKHPNIRYKLNNFIKPFDLDNTHNNDNILQQYFIKKIGL